MTFAGRLEARFTVPAAVSLDATNGTGGPTSVGVTAADYYLSDHGVSIAGFIAHLQSQLNALRPSGWTVTLSTTTGKVTINCTDTPWSITWTSTALRDLLGFTADIVGVTSAQTGANHARGLWLPGCPLLVDHYVTGAPRVTDLRQSETPNGLIIAHVGNLKYRHRNALWSHVPASQVFVAAETTTHASFERFLLDTQWGQGHAWFTPSSKLHLLDHAGNRLGGGSVDGWYAKGLEALDPRRADSSWDGLWQLEIPELVSDG